MGTFERVTRVYEDIIAMKYFLRSTGKFKAVGKPDVGIWALLQ